MVAGDVQETTRLLENKFDYIFFTGASHGFCAAKKRGSHQTPPWGAYPASRTPCPCSKAAGLTGLGIWCRDPLEDLGCVPLRVWWDLVPFPGTWLPRVPRPRAAPQPVGSSP